MFAVTAIDGLKSEKWYTLSPPGSSPSYRDAFGAAAKMPASTSFGGAASGNCEPSSQFEHGTSM